MGRNPLPLNEGTTIRMRELREVKGINLPELARRIGHSKGYLSRIERGDVDRPDAEILAKIAHELGVEVSDLGFQPRVRQGGRGSGITVIILNVFLGGKQEE